MAGHGNWSIVKRFKEALEVRRGKPCSKLSQEIAVAAKRGKALPPAPRLRPAVQAAHPQSMPHPNIERAIPTAA